MRHLGRKSWRRYSELAYENGGHPCGNCCCEAEADCRRLATATCCSDRNHVLTLLCQRIDQCQNCVSLVRRTCLRHLLSIMMSTRNHLNCGTHKPTYSGRITGRATDTRRLWTTGDPLYSSVNKYLNYCDDTCCKVWSERTTRKERSKGASTEEHMIKWPSTCVLCTKFQTATLVKLAIDSGQ